MSAVAAMMNVTASLAGAGGVTTFSHVGVSYQRTTTDTSTPTFSPPTGAQAGDVLVLTSYINKVGVSVTSGPTGWTSVGAGSAHPSMAHYFQIYNGNDTQWSLTWGNNDSTAGTVVAFRPNAPISNLTSEQFKSAAGDGQTITSTISSVATTNAPGARLYFYSSTATPKSSIDNVTASFSPSTNWQHVSGQGAVTSDSANYAYRLAAQGDAFVSTTASGTCSTEKFAQAFFILNAQ